MRLEPLGRTAAPLGAIFGAVLLLAGTLAAVWLFLYFPLQAGFIGTALLMLLPVALLWPLMGGVSLLIGFVAGITATAIGLTLGLLAGYVGGLMDDAVERVIAEPEHRSDLPQLLDAVGDELPAGVSVTEVFLSGGRLSLRGLADAAGVALP